MPSAMTESVRPSESACPYLTCAKTAFRASLDLSAAAPVSVIATWYCRHSFHGMDLELGDARREAEQHCAACPLPRRLSDDDAH